MANRHFQNHMQHVIHEPVCLFLEFTVGASGAPTLVDNGGISTIVRDSAGRYTVTLQDHYYSLLRVDFERPREDADPQVWGHVVSEDVNNTTTPVIVISYKVEGGTETDPNQSSRCCAGVWLKNSAVSV